MLAESLAGAARAQPAAQAVLGFARGDPRGAAQATPGRARLIVLEFLDAPPAQGLGLSVAMLLQKELLDALADPTEGAVVLPALAPAARGRAAEALEREQHRAAHRVAAESLGRVALWGRVVAFHDWVVLQSAVTLALPANDPDLALQLTADRARVPDIAAELSWTRFDFPPLALRRSTFFDRMIVAGAGGLELRAAPDPAAPVIRVAAPGQALRIRDMEGAWYATNDGPRNAFIDTGARRNLAAAFEILPRRAAVARGMAVHGAPAAAAPATPQEAPGLYRVIGQQLVDGKMWLQLDLGRGRVWLPQTAATAIPELPAAHLALGLHRALSGDARGAARDLGYFLMRPAGERPAIADAGARQMLALMLLETDGAVPEQRAAALALLDGAVAATPRDPTALALRAVARLGNGRVAAALDDIEAALERDPRHARARGLLAAFDRAGDLPGMAALRAPEIRQRIALALRQLSGPPNAAPDQRRLVDDLRRLFAPP